MTPLRAVAAALFAAALLPAAAHANATVSKTSPQIVYQGTDGVDDISVSLNNPPAIIFQAGGATLMDAGANCSGVAGQEHTRIACQPGTAAINLARRRRQGPRRLGRPRDDLRRRLRQRHAQRGQQRHQQRERRRRRRRDHGVRRERRPGERRHRRRHDPLSQRLGRHPRRRRDRPAPALLAVARDGQPGRHRERRRRRERPRRRREPHRQRPRPTPSPAPRPPTC